MLHGELLIVGWFRRWFESATTFAVIASGVDDVAGRQRLTWRFDVASHPGTGDPATHQIEQTLFCDLEGDEVVRLDLADLRCSGVRRA